MDIDQNARFLILDTEFESLYKNWKDGNKLTISLLERTWEIVVIWKYGRCMFGSGWYEFAVDTNLEDGDTLVLSKLHRSMPDKLKACVFKLHTDCFDEDKAAVGIEVAAHDNLAENVEINEDVMNDEILEFSVALKVSHVNHSSHGVHIPSHVSARNRDWQSGEEVMLRTDVGTWMVRIVFNNGSPRFSAGWNKFARDNKFIVNQKLVFTLIEEDDVIVFDIQSV
ncbi:hypothetical protein POM88_018042 [Heracleum sosnowskyi]|uniref:TF-B3 domain-containing protein n=1 Tax=Heracleum sosnowskyi TaxID=360622 RepID=A0AAD8IRN1_9APIA|nr:hypothetical protein POM88_018042 [Heracleum sosnowskyi]